MSQQPPPNFNFDTSGGKDNSASKQPEPQSGAKKLLSSLSATAGAAAKLVVLQTERTKLTTMTLPAAYRALGKDCVQQKRHLESVPELMQQLRSVMGDLKALSEAATAQPAAQSLTDKAKAVGKQAADFARQKQLGMKRDALNADIGKAIHDQQGDASGQTELVAPIRDALTRLSEVDADISRLSEIGKGSFLTPKRLLIGGGIAAVLLVGVMAIRWSGKDISRQLPDAPFSEDNSNLSVSDLSELKKAIEDGDAFYDAAKKGIPKSAVTDGSDMSQLVDAQNANYRSALECYMTAVNAKRAIPDNSVMAKVYGRVIDIALKQRNKGLAKEVALKSLRNEILPVCSHPEASQVLESARQGVKQEEKEADEWLERNSDNSSSSQNKGSTRSNGNVGPASSDEERGNVLVHRIRPGMTRDQVEELLGLADEEKEDDLGEFNPEKSGQILTILTWNANEGSDFPSIKLGFINDRLKDGGTPGFDINRGLKSKLPTNMNPQEKAKLKAAAKKLGISTEDD